MRCWSATSAPICFDHVRPRATPQRPMVLASGVLALCVLGATKVPMFGTTKCIGGGVFPLVPTGIRRFLQARFSHGSDSVTTKGQTPLDDTQRVTDG
jgi:hypothetical protein